MVKQIYPHEIYGKWLEVADYGCEKLRMWGMDINDILSSY